MSDDDGHQANRIAALRLALATVTDSHETLRAIVDGITERGGCWGCIAREILTVLADLTNDTGIRYIEAQLAEALDQAAQP
jgi:hypothetical protein